MPYLEPRQLAPHCFKTPQQQIEVMIRGRCQQGCGKPGELLSEVVVLCKPSVELLFADGALLGFS